MSKELLQQALDALFVAEAALADIGDADREPGDDLNWCEARAALALALPRKVIAELQVALAQPVQPEQPHGWVLVPNEPATPTPDYKECARQATVATGLQTQYPSAWLSIFIREINRWCQHAAQPVQPAAFQPFTAAQIWAMFDASQNVGYMEYESYSQGVEDCQAVYMVQPISEDMK